MKCKQTNYNNVSWVAMLETNSFWHAQNRFKAISLVVISQAGLNKVCARYGSKYFIWYSENLVGTRKKICGQTYIGVWKLWQICLFQVLMKK